MKSRVNSDNTSLLPLNDLLSNLWNIKSFFEKKVLKIIFEKTGVKIKENNIEKE